MNWVEVTPETVLPKGTHLLALRKRNKFPDKFHDETKPGWYLIDAIVVNRVGDICGEKHPNRDDITWYSPSYTSACSRPHETYSHYALLSDLTLPPIGEPTADEIAKHEEWLASSRANAKRMDELFRRIYPDKMMVKP